MAGERVFVAHAGVTALPRVAAEAMKGHIEAGSRHEQEFGEVLRDIQRARGVGARWLGKSADEVALLGPTSLGLSLFAQGLSWREGDEVVVYEDDYPANVYPWMEQRRRGVRLVSVSPRVPGRITVEDVEAALSPRTRLVALASCHFFTGWRLDVAAVARLLRERGVLFSLDAIQTLGAFETPCSEVDFVSADAHKWMLGPLTAGLVGVAKDRFEECRPVLLGAWNVESPDFWALGEVKFVPGARRYEPGVLNVTGVYGMIASLEMIERAGLKRVSAAILGLRDYLEEQLEKRGWEFASPCRWEPWRSGILTARPPLNYLGGAERAWDCLCAKKITASLRRGRDGRAWIRFSPHFYNTFEEMERILWALRGEG